MKRGCPASEVPDPQDPKPLHELESSGETYCTATAAARFRCPLKFKHEGDHIFPNPSDWQGWVVIYRFKRKKKMHWAEALMAHKAGHIDRGDEFLFCFGPFMNKELAKNYSYDATFGPQYKKKKYVLHIGDPYEMGLN